jgi:hypothetical protein
MRTPYQNRILEKAKVKIAVKMPVSDELIINELLFAIEERDKVLERHYHFFGPGRREADIIAKVLDIP